MSNTVTMILPRKVTIHDVKHVAHSFGPGICEVPEEFANHWYMEAHGAQKYDPKAEAAKLQKEADQIELKAKIEVAKAELAEAEKSGKEYEIKKAQSKLDRLTGSQE